MADSDPRVLMFPASRWRVPPLTSAASDMLLSALVEIVKRLPEQDRRLLLGLARSLESPNEVRV